VAWHLLLDVRINNAVYVRARYMFQYHIRQSQLGTIANYVL